MQPEEFTSHIVFEKLEQFKQALDSDNAKEKIGIEHFSFFDMAYQFLIDRLKLTIPILVQRTELKALASEIEAGTVQINSYLGNNNAGHITNAKNSFNSALSRVRNFPMPLSKGDFNFSKVIAGFQKTVEDSYKSIDDENKKLQESLKTIQQDLEDKNKQVTDLQKQLVSKEIEIQNVLTKYNTDFEAEKTKFNNNFDADRKSFKEQIESDKENYQKEFEEQKTDLENQTNQIIEQLQSKLDEAKKIVNIVGNVGVTGNYQNIANYHKRSANMFRWIGFTIMMIMSGLLIWTIIDLSNESFDLYKSIVRIIATSILTYPAIYASKESSKHRTLETKNRNLELELASLGPFIELLPEDKKNIIKEELVHKYFGNGSSTDSEKESEDDVSISGLEKILKALTPFLKK